MAFPRRFPKLRRLIRRRKQTFLSNEVKGSPTAYSVNIYFWHAWQTDLRITNVRPVVYVYLYPDYLNPISIIHDGAPYDGLIPLSLGAGTYKFSCSATRMKHDIIEDVVIDRDKIINAYLPPDKTVYVSALDKSSVYEPPYLSIPDVKVECTKFVPKVAYTAILNGYSGVYFDYGYNAYRQKVTVYASKPGYDPEFQTVDTDAPDWEEDITFLLTPTGWEPPPPTFEHIYMETYKDYEIHFFPEPNVYGVYLLPGESPPTGPVPIDEKWDTADSVAVCRGIIDILVGEPVFVQNYPPISPTHVDPGWVIWQEPGGSRRYYATERDTGYLVSAYWLDLQGLLDWVDNHLVPTGHVWTHQGIPVDFQLAGHVYYAKVGIHGKHFYDWAFQDCLDWIDKELVVVLTLTLTVDKTTGYIGDTFGFSGYFTQDGAAIVETYVTLYRDGVAVGTAVTDSRGFYSISWVADVTGTFTFHTEAPTPT